MNKWITHVKKYAKKHNIGYNEALRSKKCQMEYRKTSPKGRKTSPKGRKTSPKGRKTSPRGRKKMNAWFTKEKRERDKKTREAIIRKLNKVTDKVDRMKTKEEEYLNTAIENKRETLETLKRGGEKMVPEEGIMELHDLSTEHLKNKCKETVNTLIFMMKNEGDNITNKSEGKDYITRKFTHLKTIKDLFSVNCSKFYTEDPDMITKNMKLENAYREYEEIYDRYKSN